LGRATHPAKATRPRLRPWPTQRNRGCLKKFLCATELTTKRPNHHTFCPAGIVNISVLERYQLSMEVAAHMRTATSRRRGISCISSRCRGAGIVPATFSPVRRCAAGCIAAPDRRPLKLALLFAMKFFSSASMVVEAWRVGIEISRGAHQAWRDWQPRPRVARRNSTPYLRCGIHRLAIGPGSASEEETDRILWNLSIMASNMS